MNTIDTTLNGITEADFSSFGETSTSTYGQIFKTPDNTNILLQDFSFWVDPDGSNATKLVTTQA